MGELNEYLKFVPEEKRKFFKTQGYFRKRCSGCKHHLQMFANPRIRICGYMLDTGEKRNCPAEFCDKYETGKRKRNNKVM